jgi:membrane protease YdiL (CAAX protease family)
MLSQKPWRAEAVIQLIAALFVSLFFGVVVAGLLRQFGVPAFKSPDSFANLLLGTLSFQGAAWIFIFFFLKLHAVNWRDALGLREPGFSKTLLFAAGLLLLVLPVVLGLEKISAVILEKIGWPVEDQRAVEVFANAKSFGLRIYLVLFAVVIAPVAEEFVFRGILYPYIKQLGWPKLALVGVSFLFALIHVNAPTFVPLFVLALALTWLYERTDRLIAPIVAHGLFNGANLVLLFAQAR